jgi:hypothetical protein
VENKDIFRIAAINDGVHETDRGCRYACNSNKSKAESAFSRIMDIHDEIRNRLNSGNAYRRSVHNLLSSRLIQKN